MHISKVEQSALNALFASLGKQGVIDHWGFTHPAKKSVDATIAFRIGHQVYAQGYLGN
jgi:hypothetical protein